MLYETARNHQIAAALCCPLCREDLTSEGSNFRCVGCGQLFPLTASGQADFRVKPEHCLRFTQEHTPPSYNHQVADIPLHHEMACSERRNSFRGTVPPHMTSHQISYIPEAAGPNEVALDLGCGNGIHRELLRALGYTSYSVDYSGLAAEDLVDAHALPYREASFELVLSVAVLEHLANPFKALGEIHRTLRPLKRLIGTVAFLEPFHDDSFFHFTHLGLCNALRSSGFQVEDIFSICGWNVALAQLKMGFGGQFPTWIPAMVSRLFSVSLECYAFLGRRLAKDKNRHQRPLALARHAGAFFFVAQKRA